MYNSSPEKIKTSPAIHGAFDFIELACNFYSGLDFFFITR